MAKIVLQRGKEKKIQNFYPNVFQDEIREKIGAMKTGDLVDIVTEEMEFIARGYVTEGSSAYVRILSTKEEKIDKNFFQRRIRNAYERRKNLLQETNCVRVFFSEGDGIPGLIIDKFEHYVAVQFRNSGLEAFRQEILNAIKKYLKPKGIYERSDVENRTQTGR